MTHARRASLADMAAMWAVRTAAVRHGCASHYPAQVIDVWCASPPPESMPALVAAGNARIIEEDGRVLGYGIVDTMRGEIDALFVDPVQQGRGLAQALMRSLEALAREHGIAQLHLSASLNAVPFYARAGFAAVRDEMYRHRSGIDIASVFMTKRLDAMLLDDAPPVHR